MKIELTVTERGFPIGNFKDRYNKNCSIQKSSLADDECIWLGVDNANPQIMASRAAAHGIETNETTGWVRFPIPTDVSLTTRMHLSREQVADLLPLLQNFVNTGEL